MVSASPPLHRNRALSRHHPAFLLRLAAYPRQRLVPAVRYRRLVHAETLTVLLASRPVARMIAQRRPVVTAAAQPAAPCSLKLAHPVQAGAGVASRALRRYRIRPAAGHGLVRVGGADR